MIQQQQANPFDQFDAAPGPQVVIPVAPSVIAKDAADLTNTRLSGQRTAQQIAQDARTAPFQARQAAAAATKAEIEAEKSRRELATAPAAADPVQQARIASLANDDFLAAVERARADIAKGYSTGRWARLPGGLMPQNAIDLEGSLSTIGSRQVLDKLAQMKAASPTGASGLGALTEKEGNYLRDSIASLGQTQSEERLLENLAAIERHYRNYAALTAGEDYRDPKVAEKYGIVAIPVGGQTGEALSLSKGAVSEEPDPALKGVNNHVRGMLGRGHPAADIVKYLNSVQPGLGDRRAEDVRAATRFRAQNPTVPLNRYAVSVENRAVPMSGLRQNLNSLAQSPFGAYVTGAADTLTAGTLDNMLSNPALARAGMSEIRDRNPVSSFAGTVTGAGLASGGMAAGITRMGAGAIAPALADAAYGAAYGAGSSDEGSRLSGALTGGALGAAGGAVGRMAFRGAGRALTGVRDEAVQTLRQAGVPLTVGQAVGRSGRLGRSIKAREDRLTGFTGVGDNIEQLRRQGLEGFNRAAQNEGLAPIGVTPLNLLGEEAVEGGRRAIGAEYDRVLNPLRMQADAPFVADMGASVRAGRALPEPMRGNMEYTLPTRVGNSFDQGGGLAGRDFQQAVRGLEQDARAVRNQPYGGDFGRVARQARAALEGMLERQYPGALDDYLNANAAYRNQSVLADATAAAMNTDGIFTPAQLGQAARSNARQFTGRMSAATTERPFFELQRAGQRVLPSRVPDSGTAGRVEQSKGIAALPLRMARAAVNGPLYAEGTQGALNRALLDRSAAAVLAGEQVLQRARLGGMFGNALALTSGPFAVRPPY